MSAEITAQRAQNLTDIELAVLLCLISHQHCIIETEGEAINTLVDELQLIASNVFTLSKSVLHCSASTTLEDFVEGVLVDEAQSRNDHMEKTRSILGSHGDRKIAELVIITDINVADEDVQIQALELLRVGRIFTNTAIHNSQKVFCVVFVNARGGPATVHHLVDHVSISHYHDPNDGFTNLEEASEYITGDDSSSSSSVLRQSFQKRHNASNRKAPVFSEEEIAHLSTLTPTVHLSSEITAYLHDITIYLRLNRAVAGGISPRATRHFELLVKCLAPLHGLDYVTPSLVALAARKIYPHRIRITAPERERSMQWGSDLEAVKELLEGITAGEIVEEVLREVPAPL